MSMIGKTLAHYEITSQLGKGGMGEVYQAKDKKLGRDVAIKVLSEEFAKDADRVARFQREAKLLASLNHPSIAAIYGLEESGETRYLVMELVEGETLADRIKANPVPVEEALKLARQIAEALEAAHEKGVIHRDLKPANIKVTPDGKVKVLDFGLAKAFAGEQDPLNLSNSPTLSNAATQQGVILGTAAYMSPEQAKGKIVDKRVDIWAFGCVLYEMLTGQAAFQGEDVTEILAAVVKSGADLDLLPANIHPRVREVITRCLQKDLKRRYQDIGDVRFEIVTIQSMPETLAVELPHSSKFALLWKISAASFLAFMLGFAARSVFWSESRSAQVTRLSFSLPEGSEFTNIGRPAIAISADGTKIVYNADRQLYVRSLDKMDPEPIRGSASPTGLTSPAFSPDGEWVIYESDGFLRKIPITGGASQSICSTPSGNFGISWGPGNDVFFAHRGGINRISAGRGPATPIVTAKPDEVMHGPQMLSDGDHLLFTVTTDTSNDRWEKAQVVIQSLSSGKRTVIIQNGSDGRYVPTGHIVYRVGATIFAVRFDIKRLSAVGTPVAILEGVLCLRGGLATPAVQYSYSAMGSMAYIPTATEDWRVVIVGSDGRINSAGFTNDAVTFPRVSPDGRQLAGYSQGGLWIYDLTGKTAPIHIASEASVLLWAPPDGKRIAFVSGMGTDRGVYTQDMTTNAPPELVLMADQVGLLGSWSRDGHTLFFVRNNNVWAHALNEKTPKLLFPANRNQWSASISPDGRWIGYDSLEAGELNVFVQPYPPTGAKYQVSRGGGHHPLWSPDGKRLYYVRNTDQLMAVDVNAGSNITFGEPALLKVPVNQPLNINRNYDITPDGKRFVVSVSKSQNAARQIHVILNWFEELKQRVPRK